ncbi:MAG: GcrA cell cycle regulator [Rhodobacterales bacterium]|nr:GcrA cell cycle regulator [Rhodobacterales bacterium]
MSWTDERVETLKKMWSDGQSASQIAKELGGVTRNAVIGKVHRLGLSNRAGGGPVPTPAPVAPGKAAPRAARGADEDDDLIEDELPEEELAAAEEKVEDLSEHEDEEEAPDVIPMSAARRAIIPAGQPLPPQPSLNEISPEALAKVNEVEKTARKLTLMELTEKTCKWPVGDPATDNFWFCGLPVQQGKPYCEAHVGVAFQPMSARRDRRR